jgi:Domain of unknown function/Ankyrin repeats (3 copies)
MVTSITGIVMQLLKGRPQLAYCKEENGDTPLQRAITYNNLDIVKIFLEHNPNLAYIKNGNTDETPFSMAAQLGSIPIIEEIMSTCPDSAYTPDKKGYNPLHLAVQIEQSDFIEYTLKMPQLHRLINQATNGGSLPLHHAADKCEPRLLRSLLSHQGQDYTAVNVNNSNAVNIVKGQTALMKTLRWVSQFLFLLCPTLEKKNNSPVYIYIFFNFLLPLWLSSSQNESFTLLSNVIPSGWKYLIGPTTKRQIQKQAIQEVKSLTEKYTSNTSLIAALLATITFAAAFTLPGGFSSDSSDAGQPIFVRKVAFQVFLISDTVAMCSSLAVAFLCILATWEDLDFLLNYRKTTRTLMWCAYVTTALAFGTGLFTIMAPKRLWLAVIILVLCSILPFLSKIIGEWPLLMLRYRLGCNFRNDLIPHI